MKKSTHPDRREVQAALAGLEAQFGPLRIAKGARQLGVEVVPPKREPKKASKKWK